MIIKFIKNHFWKFMVFGTVGFISFLIDWVFFNMFYRLEIGFLTARVLSAMVAMTFNFTINRNITFKAHHTPVKNQVTRWLVIYTVGIGLNTLVGKLVIISLGESLLNANIAFFSGLFVSVPICFLGSLFWAFKKPKLYPTKKIKFYYNNL
jgi:putative flippase GtrA